MWMCVCVQRRFSCFKIDFNRLSFKFRKCWGHFAGVAHLFPHLQYPLSALMSKHTHTRSHRHTRGLRLMWGRWQTVQPRPRRAEWSGSPAGTLTFTLKCFNRTKVDKGRQWRSRSYNGLATLQVYWTLPIGRSYFQSHNPSSASGS